MYSIEKLEQRRLELINVYHQNQNNLKVVNEELLKIYGSIAEVEGMIAKLKQENAKDEAVKVKAKKK